MKVRNGFVSNSSSSSFIIVLKDKNKTKKDLRITLTSLFDFDSENTFLLEIIKPMSDKIINSLLSGITMHHSLEEYMEEYYLDEDCVEDYLSDYFDKGYLVFRGSVSDDYGGIDEAICEMDINYEDDVIKIVKEGGY